MTHTHLIVDDDTGTLQVCPHCDGKGLIEIFDLYPRDDPPGSGLTICVGCYGTGVIVADDEVVS